jgi:transcriptional antiterminator RfaH
LIEGDERWLLLRTKPREERIACEQLARITSEVFLPLMRGRVRRWGRLVESIMPLFPCYLFARVNPEREYSRLPYTRGLQGFVYLGDHPAMVPDAVIAELQRRCAGGVIENPQRPLALGEPVVVVEGPFCQLEGIFERYCSGSERVAILLNVINGGTRVFLPASSVASPGAP